MCNYIYDYIYKLYMILYYIIYVYIVSSYNIRYRYRLPVDACSSLRPRDVSGTLRKALS